MRQERLRELQIKKAFEDITKIENSIGEAHYDLQGEISTQVHIRVVADVPAAMFKPDPLLPGGWIANDLTFRAMKKDIFALGEQLDELSSPVNCPRCNSKLDQQFWQLCPYCGKDLPQ